ncbi:hypothetical protein [Streptomyces sp. CBMA156]|uniref:hypothetical protein n=1 Tax=Streptomyces sp. CBMA156 TaxID=1930280 RepID=UPI001661D012|nr:hypothetical protein [Streptomyces sp. CBMA156]MBD0673235.1 hypothetical protein [Streptomyces sp. CBMA156]
MPVRLLAALLLGLFSLLPAGCAPQHLGAHQPHSPAATARATTPPESAYTTPSAPAFTFAHGPDGVPADASERSCPEEEDTAPGHRALRSPAVPVPSCTLPPVTAPGVDRAQPPADRPAAPVVRAARTPGPRGPLLVTGRWRI